MRRSIASLALAVLVALPVVGPAAAGEPFPGEPAPAASEPAASPEPTPTAETDPQTEPSPPVEPSPDATPDPDAEPTAEPGADPADPAEPGTDPADPAPATDPGPATDPTPSAATDPVRGPDKDGVKPDPTGRYIVMLAGGADTAAVERRLERRQGISAIRTFGRAIRGFSTRLDVAQRRALLSDPAVQAVVPDEIIELTAQTIPNGIRRIGGRSSSAAAIDGLDQRVDADVAIVDTGIAAHPDLNVAGGYNCSTSDRTAWRDVHGHGTHVAGTIGALDNDFGVVGVAPGVRVWAVKILNDSGYGLLSWYVCGLDWILAQRDPNDSSRPRFESVNMSVAKSGSDDGACGRLNDDPLHAAICRVVAGGITIAAAAANDSGSATKRVPAAYNEVITVSALADTDGKPGGLGGRGCYSWGTYDRDDTFADFSNYGFDVDLIASGKCIYSTIGTGSYGYMSGTSMATPAVAGAAALYKASRPLATPAEVKASLQYLGNLNWNLATDPDRYHEKLLDVSRLGKLGTFSFGAAPTGGPVGERGGTTTRTVTLARSTTFFERVSLRVSNVPSGWSASLSKSSLFGWTARSVDLRVAVPARTSPGTYRIRVTGTNWGRSDVVEVPIVVENDAPTLGSLRVAPPTGATLATSSTVPTSVTMRVSWGAATDRSSAIAGYEIEHSVNGGAFGGTRSVGPSTRRVDYSRVDLSVSHDFRIRARDTAGNWSSWKTLGADATYVNVNDRSSVIRYTASWRRESNASSTWGVRTTSRTAGAKASYTFTGRGIAVVMPRYKTRGKVSIYVDGVYKGRVDTYASVGQHRRVIWAGTWTSSGTHTIVLRVHGTSGRPTVSLDGFIVTK